MLEFENGATVAMGTSWDVWSHDHRNMELYGEDGTLYVPDPNFFGGDLRMTKGNEPVKKLAKFDHPFAVINESNGTRRQANYRTSGLADMAQAIIDGRPHRCSLELALHAVDVMTSILKSGETGRFVTVATTCERPAPLGIKDAKALLAKKAAPKKAKAKRKGK